MRLYVIKRIMIFLLFQVESHIFLHFFKTHERRDTKCMFGNFWTSWLSWYWVSQQSNHHNQDDKLHIYALWKSHLIIVDIFHNWIIKFSDKILFEVLRPVLINITDSTGRKSSNKILSLNLLIQLWNISTTIKWDFISA